MVPASEKYAQRRNKLRNILLDRSFDGLLVQSEKNVTWLTGFSGDSTWLLVTQDSELLVSDFRYTAQLGEECPGVPVRIRPSSISLAESLAEAVPASVRRLGFEGHVISFELWNRLSSLLPETQLENCGGEIEFLRSTKDADEIAEIQSAVKFAQKGWEFFRDNLAPEKRERELAADLEHALRRFGADGCSFPSIVAVGDRAALPHYRPGEIRVSASPILLLDWGARTVSGYCSDLTRTMLTGPADERFETVYKTVLEAQLSAIDAIRAGVTCAEVDCAARAVIEKAGFGEYFDHGLGHGIGMDVHEAPRLSRKIETVLQPGMVVTVEPGIYLPGWGGVRIEDDVLVTEAGCEVLSSIPKDWESVRLSG